MGRFRSGKDAGRRAALTLLALATAGCVARSQPEPYVPPAEYWRFDFDGRDWRAASRVREGSSAKELYVLPGQDEESWTELVSSTLSFGAHRNTTVRAVAEATRKSLAMDCPSFQWAYIQQLGDTVIYEWSRGICKDVQPQHEVSRLTAGRLGIHKLSFASRTPSMPQGLRRMWLRLLRRATLERRTGGPPPQDGGSSATD